MHREFRKLIENATGIPEHIIALNLDIRGFTPFCQSVESLDVATYIKKIYMKIIDNYFSNASFYKPTGDGLLIIINYNEEKLKDIMNKTIESSLNIVKNFSILCKDEPMINYPTPEKIGIGLCRGSACCISSNEKILDYSGRVLNLASRLMDVARPSGIVFDESFGIELLEDDKKELFSEDEIYIRGVAEEKPIGIHYLNNYTIISESFKKPIKEPIWEIITEKHIFSEFKKLDKNYRVQLKHKPLDKNKIFGTFSHNKVINGKIKKDIQVNHDIKIDELFYYYEVGKNCFVEINKNFPESLLNEHGVLDEMEVTYTVQYTIKP